MIREDLKFSDYLTKIYTNINYYDRYKKLSDQYNTEEERLEKVDKKVVLKILKELGYSEAKYIATESFYQINQELQNHIFYFHTSLKYGVVELIFGVLKSDKEKQELIGGTASKVCKLIEINKSSLTEGYIKKPRFRTYKELKEILEKAFSLYEDLKKEFIKIYK